MKRQRSTTRSLKPGDVISFRIPSDATQEEIAVLETLRNQRDRSNASYISSIVMQVIRTQLHDDTTQISLPVPTALTTEQNAQLARPDVSQMLGYSAYATLLWLTGGSEGLPPVTQPMQCSIEGKNEDNTTPKVTIDPKIARLMRDVYQD